MKEGFYLSPDGTKTEQLRRRLLCSSEDRRV
jgi:hypothetical protein